MTKSDHRNWIFFWQGTLFFIWLVLSVLATGLAQDKTPPCFPDVYEEKSISVGHPVAGHDMKNFSALFNKPGSTEGAQKALSRDKKDSRDASSSQAKPDDKDLAGQVPGLGQGILQTQEYVVKEGDYLVKILRQKGLIKDHNLPELLSLLRKLNTSLQDLDLIRPGEKIVILVKVMPEGTSEKGTPHRLKHDRYRVKRGDRLSRIAMHRFNLSRKTFYREYLKLFSACNPSIKNPDWLLAGQVINLPHYPPSYVETITESPSRSDMEGPGQSLALKPPIPVKRPETPVSGPETSPPVSPPVKAVPALPSSKPASRLSKSKKARRTEEKTASKRTAQPTVYITDGLGAIIAGMGEEWIDSGEHIIPIKSGGYIRLTADSYPIVRLQKGITVIVDLHSALPSKVVGVLESTWANYRVVQLSARDDLRSTLDKILRSFNYPKILRRDEPLVLGGEVPVTITGDWIITPPQTDSGKKPGFVAIYLMEDGNQGIPPVIKRYLKLLGVTVVEYPAKPSLTDTSNTALLISACAAKDPKEMIGAVLDLTGATFASDVNIPVYATHNKDFRFEVCADFCLEIKGRRYIIDVRGLGPDIISLLEENDIPVLSLAKGENMVKIVSAILDLLGIPFVKGPHVFLAREGDASRNVKLTVPGITFFGPNGHRVLATPVNLSPEIVTFLSQKGYRTLVLPHHGPPHSGRT